MMSSLTSAPIRKKRLSGAKHPRPGSSSLIRNIVPPDAASTNRCPKEYGLVREKQVFPATASSSPDVAVRRWEPPENATSPNDGCLAVPLRNSSSPSPNKNNNDNSISETNSRENTVVLKATVPSESKRFSFNIASEQHHDNFNNILFHFNPRQHEKGGVLVLNDKTNGTWGKAVAIPLCQLPVVIFGRPRQQKLTIGIQVRPAGFDVFLDGRHCARLERHGDARRHLDGNDSLVVHCPSTDDSGKREDWLLESVWWGHREPRKSNITSSADVAGANDFNREHPRKLFLRGLAKAVTASEVELRRSQLERAFRKYGGRHGVHVVVPRNRGFAFVETESKEKADLALKEMSGHFLLSRAQCSRRLARDQGCIL